MKKIIFLFVISNVVLFNGFSQENIIDELASFIGNTVLLSFTREDDDHVYSNQNFHGNIAYLFTVSWKDHEYVYDDSVYSGDIRIIAGTFEEANNWLLQFYDMAKKQNWEFYQKRENGEEIYRKDKIYLIFIPPHHVTASGSPDYGKYYSALYFTFALGTYYS